MSAGWTPLICSCSWLVWLCHRSAAVKISAITRRVTETRRCWRTSAGPRHTRFRFGCTPRPDMAASALQVSSTHFLMVRKTCGCEIFRVHIFLWSGLLFPLGWFGINFWLYFLPIHPSAVCSLSVLSLWNCLVLLCLFLRTRLPVFAPGHPYRCRDAASRHIHLCGCLLHTVRTGERERRQRRWQLLEGKDADKITGNVKQENWEAATVTLILQLCTSLFFCLYKSSVINGGFSLC